MEGGGRVGGGGGSGGGVGACVLEARRVHVDAVGCKRPVRCRSRSRGGWLSQPGFTKGGGRAWGRMMGEDDMCATVRGVSVLCLLCLCCVCVYARARMEHLCLCCVCVSARVKMLV